MMRNENVFYSDSGEAVSEANARALAIHHAIKPELQENYESQKATVRNSFLLAIAISTAGIVGLLVNGSLIVWGLVAAGPVVFGGGKLYAGSMTPDVEVQELAKGYWTGYAIQQDEETYLFDATDTTETTTFELDLLSDETAVADVRNDLKEFDDRPVITTEDTNPEAQFLDNFGEVDRILDNTEVHEFEAPLIKDDDTAESIDMLAGGTSEAMIDTGDITMSFAEAESKVERLAEFEELIDEEQGESLLQDIENQGKVIADDLTQLQETAVELLNDHIQTAGDMFGQITYHFYCPDCAEDDIDTVLVHPPNVELWHCDACRSDFSYGEGIPRHKIRDDIVLDVVDRLWIEKDDERRKIYDSIEDQKTELKDKEYSEKQETIRSVGDRIKTLRREIKDLKTEAQAKEEAVDRIGSLMVKYERLHEERSENFKEDVSAAFEEIDEETEQIMEETRSVEQEKLEEAEEEAEAKAELMREEERAMEREKLAMQQQMMEEQTQELLEGQEEITKQQTQAIREGQEQQTAEIQAGQAKSTNLTLRALKDGKGGQ